MNTPRLVLGSSSPYRKEQLELLGLRFETSNPNFEETELDGESPTEMARRLGIGKALSVSEQLKLSAVDTATRGWIAIASDQVCHLGEEIFRKPGSRSVATSHIQRFSGQWVSYSSSLALVTSEGQRLDCVESYDLHFRTLSLADIEAYLDLDQPYDCAGAIKIERAGVTLLDDSRGRDINTVYGMPLMALGDLLGELGHGINDFR